MLGSHSLLTPSNAICILPANLEIATEILKIILSSKKNILEKCTKKSFAAKGQKYAIRYFRQKSKCEKGVRILYRFGTLIEMKD